MGYEDIPIKGEGLSIKLIQRQPDGIRKIAPGQSPPRKNTLETIFRGRFSRGHFSSGAIVRGRFSRGRLSKIQPDGEERAPEKINHFISCVVRSFSWRPPLQGLIAEIGPPTVR